MEPQVSSRMKKVVLVIYCIILAIGNCGAPLLTRLYFIKGGKRLWLTSWLVSCAWPINFIPLAISYFYRCRGRGRARARARASASAALAENDNVKRTTLIFMRSRIFIPTALIGLVSGAVNYLYAYGAQKLPVSTSSLLVASQLAFTACFAFLLVKHKFTAYTVNTIVLLTVGAVVVALHGSHDRPEGLSNKGYILGFVMIISSAALNGLILPLMELMYMKAKQTITYTLLLEIQIVMCLSANIVSTIGMIINNDFQAIPKEAKTFELGEVRYYVVIVWSAIMWQLLNFGAIGVIQSSSSMVSGILVSGLIPVTQVLAVIFYSEKFQPEKGVSLVLSLWGIISYFYGQIKSNKKMENQSSQTEMIDQTCTP